MAEKKIKEIMTEKRKALDSSLMEKNKKFKLSLIINIMIFVIGLSVVGIALSTILGRPKNYYNGGLVSNVKVYDEEDKMFDISSFELSDIKLLFEYENKDPTIEDLQRTWISDKNRDFLTNLDKKTSTWTDIHFEQFNISFDLTFLLYYIPTRDDIYTSKANIYNSEAKYLDYGLYPQTLQTNREIIDILDSKRDFEGKGFIYYDNQMYYRNRMEVGLRNEDPVHFLSKNSEQVLRDIPSNSSEFDLENGIEKYRSHYSWSISDENDVLKAIYYYFKCEPLKFRVLQNANETNDLFLMTDVLVDCFSYEGEGASINDYATSIIRQRLNERVYNLFDEPFKEKFVLSNVDNSNQGWNVDGLEHEDCQDYFYLPAHNDLFLGDFANSGWNYLTDSYNSNPDDDKVGKYSDYSLLFAEKNDSNTNEYETNKAYQYGRFWTRTYHDSNPDLVYVINRNGSIITNSASTTSNGIRPVVHLAL
ncbi:MAG: DUF6273 domain-containing protein [Bacillales bacterium]|jgi:hypothetical protein|nr:DUF6273 domain-containing protein [Bacillales bacterium]